ncbi:hypothetical protein GCM10027590_06050 [Nocardiopsis nanhaiensis]
MEFPQNLRAPEELHARRMRAAALFEAGKHSQAQIARLLGASCQAVHLRHNTWSKGGAQALSAAR